MNSKKICRFCRTPCDLFQTIDETSKETINKLYLDIDFSKTVDPVMCKKCSDIIAKCSQLKYRPLAQVCASRQLNLKEETVVNTSEDRTTCLLCMKILSHSYFVPLTVETKTAIKIILLKYFPEIDFNCSKDLELCGLCLKFLGVLSSFIMISLETEEKIKKNSDYNESTTKCIALSSFLEHKDLTGLPKIKTENISSDTTSIANTPEDHKINIKHELIYSPQDNVLLTRHSAMNVPEKITKTMRKSTTYSLDYKPVQRNTFQTKCQLYQYQMHECTDCRFESKHNKTKRHGNVNTCNLCGYQTKFRDSLLQHMVIHKRSSKHKCTECDFETIHKICLRRHMLRHKNVRKGNCNKCSFCDYQTKFKDSLRQHMVVHKSRSEVIVHKCTKCGQSHNVRKV